MYQFGRTCCGSEKSNGFYSFTLQTTVECFVEYIPVVCTYITVIFTEEDFYSMLTNIPDIGIKRHERPITDWM